MRSLDELVGWLQAQGAQGDLVTWVRTRGLGWPEAWHACPRGDWLLALAHRAGVAPAILRRAAVAAAGELRLDIDDASFDRALGQLERDYDSTSAPDGLRETAENGSRHAHDMAQAMAWNTLSLLVDSYEDVSAATMVPMQVAEALLATVMDCGMAAAMGASLARSAERVRASVPCPTLRAV